MESHPNGESPVLVVSRRCRQVAAVVLNKHDVFEVRRLKFPQSAPEARRAKIRETLLRMAKDYGARGIVVEDDAFIGPLLACPGLPMQVMTTATAAQVLTGQNARTYRELFRTVLAWCPMLRRYVRILPVSGEISRTDRWRTHVLLACALGLAAIQL